MTNEYFSAFDQFPAFQLARAEAVNAIFQAVVVAFDNVPPSSALKQDKLTYCTDTGTAASVYVIAPTYPILAYAEGQRFSFKALHANTGAATLNVSGLGAVAIKRQDGTDLNANDVTVGRIVWLVYDGTFFQMMGATGSDVAGSLANANAAASSAVSAAASASAAAGSAIAASASATASAGSATAAAASATATAGAVTTHAALTSTHGVTGAIVGSTDAQTLTNKTMGATTFSGALTYGGVTLSNSTTGSGPLVAASGPSLSGISLSGITTSASFRNDGFSTFGGSGIAVTSGRHTFYSTAITEDAGSPIISWGKTSSSFGSGYLIAVSGASYNGANTGMYIGKDATTGRSINAGGTVNASGTDYAEYEPKADSCGLIAKGQIVGFNADALLTDKWNEAVLFGVKSTDPSFTGGNAWGSAEVIGMARPEPPNEPVKPDAPADDASAEETSAYVQADAEYSAAAEAYRALEAKYDADKIRHDALLEAARQRVDRVAYSGKVPVNVMGASPGDYIVAVQNGDGISGQIVTNPTFEQFVKTVGRVRRILGDGRAEIAVIIH